MQEEILASDGVTNQTKGEREMKKTETHDFCPHCKEEVFVSGWGNRAECPNCHRWVATIRIRVKKLVRKSVGFSTVSMLCWVSFVLTVGIFIYLYIDWVQGMNLLMDEFRTGLGSVGE